MRTVLVLLAVAIATTAVNNLTAETRSAALPHGAASYGNLPLAFEPNEGQVDPQVKFVARGPDYTVFLTSSEMVLCVAGARKLGRPVEFPLGQQKTAVLRMRMVDATPSPRAVALKPLPGKSNYFRGNDPAKWRTKVGHFAAVKYLDVYPGVDLVYYGNQRQLEYDFVIAPGVHPRRIQLEIQGANKIAVDETGNLVLRLDDVDVMWHKPVIYQNTNAKRNEVDGRYVVEANNRVSFEVGRYDESLPLIIDPVLVYSTYLGGRAGDNAFGIAVDRNGHAYVAGRTCSPDFPTKDTEQGTNAGNCDAFVTKLSRQGSALVYSTYLGGSQFEQALSIAVDQRGHAFVTGETFSTDFPTVNPAQAASGGGVDAFITELNRDGSALLYSTYLGGSGFDLGNHIAVDDHGHAYVAGETESIDFPTAQPLQGANAGGRDAFIAKLSAAGSALIYSTYVGGSANDLALGIAVDSDGHAYVTGVTQSTDFPTANPLQPANAGGPDVFVTKLNQNGSALLYSTYLGGSGSEQAFGIAVDRHGNAFITGSTTSTNFPTANPLQGSQAGGLADAFVAKVNASGSALVYSTYLGGNDIDTGQGVAVDFDGNAYVTGQTQSTNFPTADPIQSANAGGSDVFVTKLNPDGSVLIYSTYLGGSGGEAGSGIAVDRHGNTYVAGFTGSSNFPTANPLQGANAGDTDAIVVKIK